VNVIEDVIEYIRKARKYKKTKSAVENPLKIAVLGSASIQYFVLILDYLLYENNIHVEIYEGQYNGIAMDVFDESSAFYKFNPDLTILLPECSDITQFPDLCTEEGEVMRMVTEVTAYYRIIWDKIRQQLGCHIFQANFVVSLLKQLGNLECNYHFSKTIFVQLLNIELSKNRLGNVTILDVDGLASEIGKHKWFDYVSYFTSKLAYHIDYVVDYARLFVRQILVLQGKIRKCIVLDLDNTLWGGVVGDVGFDGIMLEPNNPIGEAYIQFQNYLLDLRRRGVILAVCSKNDEELAREPFERNIYMRLKLEDISCFVANWDDKATNLKKISEKLNIGLDSLVFFDDNPAEQEIVRSFLPEVLVVTVPKDPALYAISLENAKVFDWLQITNEDLYRTQSYISNQKRCKLEADFIDYDQYLAALNMELVYREIGDSDIGRFAQLINKSNQFNLRTKRYSESAIASMIEENAYRCVYIKLSDKFSNYGIISCVILQKQEAVCFIDTWVMSCRVLKRGVEDVAFGIILECAKQMQCNVIAGEYIPTAKNSMVKDLFLQFGFVQEAEKQHQCGQEEPHNSRKYTYPVEREYRSNTKIIVKGYKEDENKG